MAIGFSRITHTPDATRGLGQTIGQHLSTTMVITLFGDLGSGKTVIVQGLAQGLSVPDTYAVTSPSYTLINEYPGRLVLYHVDLYRLAGTSDFEDIGLYDILTDGGVVAIEWSERLEAGLIEDRLSIHIESIDAATRKIVLSAYGLDADNLIKRLENSNAVV